MVPTWLSRTLEFLPGKPKHHAWGLMITVFTVIVLCRVFFAYLSDLMKLIMIVAAFAIMLFVVWSDWKVRNKDLLDIRDWVVLRAISYAFWLTFFLTMASDFLVNGIKGYFDMLMALVLPFALLQYLNLFIRLLNIVKEVPSWGELKLVKRSDLET